ncbi:MAG: acyl-ACP--UDP-N-acetylglucosamine O-acyltransferase [Bacteroidetes bacterium]|nr:MAG: acyl-ACP--UDP-N-acetylglucosamine O-acyltransferase [Bacteroidota bacterium]
MNYNGLRFIHPEAKIGRNVTIEPFTTIGADVVIGDNTWIGPNVSIMDGARIGRNCKIFPGAVIGAIPQDLKFEGEYSLVELGDNVIIREYCTLNRGTKASHKTHISDDSLLMAYVHVAHDCFIGKRCILANNVTLAGHIEVQDYAIIGGMVAVHQFVKIGAHAFIGGGSLVRKDVPPYVRAAREPLSYAGINSVGLRRRGFTNEQIRRIQDVYRLLFVKGYNTSKAIHLIKTTLKPSEERDHILRFIQSSERGIMRGFRHLNGDKNPTLEKLADEEDVQISPTSLLDRLKNWWGNAGLF